jgi:hypothetical protein
MQGSDRTALAATAEASRLNDPELERAIVQAAVPETHTKGK